MHQEKQTKVFQSLVENCEKTLISKGKDYSSGADKLANFKEVANITGITPQQVALVLIAVKVSRINSLLRSSSEPNHESIEDSMLDLTNYSLLLNMLQIEEKERLELQKKSILATG